MTDPDLTDEVRNLHYAHGLLEQRIRDLESGTNTGSAVERWAMSEPPRLDLDGAKLQEPSQPALPEELKNLRLELAGSRKVAENWKRVADERTAEKDALDSTIEGLKLDLEEARQGPCERCAEPGLEERHESKMRDS